MNNTMTAWRRRVAIACVGALGALGWTTVGDTANAAITTTTMPAAQFASITGTAMRSKRSSSGDLHRHVHCKASNDRAA